jgi:hypothetical protein
MITANVDSFLVDLRRLLEKTGADADKVARKVVLDIGTSLVMQSPVGDPAIWKHAAPKGYVGGQFRSNWQHGMNIAPSGTTERIEDEAGTVARIAQRVNQASAAGMHYFANNLPYAQALEHGHSTQAPAGMVELTVNDFERFVNEACAEVKK